MKRVIAVAFLGTLLQGCTTEQMVGFKQWFNNALNQGHTILVAEPATSSSSVALVRPYYEGELVMPVRPPWALSLEQMRNLCNPAVSGPALSPSTPPWCQ